jgi:two-component system sensor histidine kinase TtrS
MLLGGALRGGDARAAEPEATKTVTVGFLAYLGEERGLETWGPTLNALRAALPGVTVQGRAFDHAGLRAALAADHLDFIITNPGHYVELESAFGASRVATLQSDAPVASVVLARRGPDAPTALADLRGTRLAIPAENAFGGFQVIWRELADAGVDPLTETALVVTGLPMTRVLEALTTGRADVGVVRACLLEDMERSRPGTAQAFQVVGERRDPAIPCALSSRVYPDWPFAKARHTDNALAQKVATALLSMPPAPDGTAWTVPLDYQPVHDLFRELRIGPYAREGKVTVAEILRDYREWLIAIAAGLGVWLLYMVRVEHLVRERTRELAQANTDLRREMAERHRIEEAARLRQRELDHVARLSLLGEMAGNIAHELNQPLGAISNYAQGCALLLDRGDADPGRLREATGRIVQQAERAALVIQRIRAFVGKRDIQRQLLDLNDLTRECEALMEAATRQAGVVCDLDLEPDPPPVVGDRVQLQQVVLNLVRNAVDAMVDTPREKRHILVTTARDREGARLTVRDRGTGFTPEALRRFREPFHTTKADGIGLGLALSGSIMEAHEGRLWAENNGDGRGASVHLWLPAAPDEGEGT